MIKPTPGRIVYYYERGMENPWPAIITEVVSDTIVHLQVLTPGDIVPRPGTLLLQDDDVPGERMHWCEWMPYQKGQAAASSDLEKRVEALEAALEPQKGAA